MFRKPMIVHENAGCIGHVTGRVAREIDRDAAWNGNFAMVNALLARGADVNVFDTDYGGSSLACALHGWHCDAGDYAGVARALLNAGATLAKAEMPREATDEVLEVMRQHAT